MEKALTNGSLRVKGKGGQVRFVPVEVEVQKNLLNYHYKYARNNNLFPRDHIISRNEKGGVERQINSLENWMYTNRDKFTMKNRQDEVRDGKKPRSKDLTWHGLRYKRAQEQYAMYEAEGRKNPKFMTSEILRIVPYLQFTVLVCASQILYDCLDCLPHAVDRQHQIKPHLVKRLFLHSVSAVRMAEKISVVCAERLKEGP